MEKENKEDTLVVEGREMKDHEGNEERKDGRTWRKREVEREEGRK